MKNIFTICIFFLSSCATGSHQYIDQVCMGKENPQIEYYTGVQVVSQFMPPLALFLTPLALLQTQKDGNVKSNYEKFIKSKNNQNLLSSLENNKTNEITIWENKKFCTKRSVKPVRTFKMNDKDCRELEWFYFKYTPSGKGNVSTGLSTYCRETNVKNWNQVSEIIKCTSNNTFNKINGNSCISDKTYKFPFSLVNPYYSNTK